MCLSAPYSTNRFCVASVAAVVHSGIGNVVANSLFATLQSAGAGGYGAAVVNAAVQGGGASVATAGAGVMAWARGDNSTNATSSG